MQSGRSTPYEAMKDFSKEYAEKGAYHSAASGFSKWWLADNYRLLASGIRQGQTVLDLACGDGALSPYLPSVTLVGIDNVQKSLDLNKMSYPGVYQDLILGDMRCLQASGLKERAFDAVICSLSLMYLVPEDLKKCLAVLYGALKDDGVFVFSYPSVHERRPPNPTAAELTISEIREIFQNAGFEIVRVRPVCPLQPSWVLSWSKKPVLSLIAYVYYAVSRLLFRNFTDSYHFVAWAKKYSVQ